MLPGIVMANGSKNRRNRRKNVPGVAVKIASGEWTGSVGEIEKIEDSVMINGLGAYYMKGTDADAMFNVGMSYYVGKGISQDDVKAFEWYLKAAECGNVDAMNKVAECYKNGKGIGKNDSKAFEWWESSSKFRT